MNTMVAFAAVALAAAGTCADMAKGSLNAPDLTPLKNVRESVGEPVEIVGVDGMAKLPIVVEDREEFVWAANFLADTVAEMTGVRPKVVREKKGAEGASGPALFVGDVAAARKAELRAPADNAEAFRVATKDGSVYFLGRGDYAVFDWCERVLDMRFYWPERPCDMYGEKGTNRVYGKCVAKTRGLSVPPIDYDDRPTFAYRHNWPYDKTAWNRVAKGGSSFRGMVNVHAPHKWHREPDAKDHLEIFARNEAGERATSPLLCYGNPATLEYYKRRIEDHLAGRRDSGGIVSKSKVVTVSQWDCDVFCTCDYCKRLFRGDLGASGSGSPIIWSCFTKKLAKWLKETHPDCLISILPYKNTCDVPEGFDVSEEGNVSAVLCTMPGLALLKDEKCKKAEEGLIRQWAKATGNKVVNWHYSCWPAEFTAAPYVYGETIARHYRDVRDCVAGTFINGGYPASRLSLSGYVWMRCLWNPDVDVQSAYDEFARRMFGRAAAPMRRIVAMQESGWNRRWEVNRPSMKNVYEISYPRKDVLEMQRLFAEARALVAGDERALARIAWYESGFETFFKESDEVEKGDAFAPFMMKKAISQPVVDGRLDDMCWSVAEGRDFVAAMDRGNSRPQAATEVKAVWTDKGVTFGVRCDEPGIAAMDLGKPTGIPVVSDNVEIFFDCSGSNNGEFRQLIVDCYGRRATVPDEAKWNTADVKIATFAGAGFWSVEVYVPYSCLKGFPEAAFPTTAANGVVWTGNFARWRVGGKELSRLNTRYNKWNRDPAAFSKFVFVE